MRSLTHLLLVFGCLVLIALGFVMVEAWRLDPYSPTSTVKSPYTTLILPNGQIDLQRTFVPSLDSNPLSQALAWLRTGIRIPLYDFLLTEKPIKDTEAHIVGVIHDDRFDPTKPYVITGGHYSDLYMRNLGIFYNALLDPRLSTNVTDWQNRQRIAVQTLAYDLDFLDQNGVAVTTIVPTGSQSFTGLNIYASPSDSLFSIFYTFKAMQQPTFITQLFPSPPGSALPLETQTIAQTLWTAHRDSLIKALDQYLDVTLDPQTGLVRTDRQYSSARDGIKRQSSFYDNVIAWSTVQMAEELGLQHALTLPPDQWRQKIIDTYWDDQLGIFKDDLTPGPTVFSADSLIVTSSGFFDLTQAADQNRLARMLSYIQAQRLDQPFPLRYAVSSSSSTFQLPVKFLAPGYMSDAIWSHWGMEYIKALLMLTPQHPEYGGLASQFLDSYKQNIEKSGGYPELYNSNGTVFKSILVKSVLDAGWVVNYEQAKVMAGT